VSKKLAAMREYYVEIPMEGLVYGSHFGTYTCGFPTKEGISCNHIIAIVKLSVIADLSRVQIMPFWYMHAQWRLQFPKDAVFSCRMDVTLALIKKSGSKDIHMTYCPHWVAPRKKGLGRSDALRRKFEGRELQIMFNRGLLSSSIATKRYEQKSTGGEMRTMWALVISKTLWWKI
jgi:hypothetical protein